MSLFVAILLTTITLSLFAWLFARLVGRRLGRDRVESRERARVSGPGPLGGLRGALSRLWRSGESEGPAPDDPRAAIRYHYRQFQTLMARADLARRTSQTPREYAGALRGALPTSAEQLATITDAYILARYGPETTRVPEPGAVGQAVDEIRVALRSGEQGQQSNGKAPALRDGPSTD
jgi:hypothetical protein